MCVCARVRAWYKKFYVSCVHTQIIKGIQPRIMSAQSQMMRKHTQKRAFRKLHGGQLAGTGAASLRVYSPDPPGARHNGDQRTNVPPAAVTGTAHSRGGYAARKETHVCKCPSVHTKCAHQVCTPTASTAPTCTRAARSRFASSVPDLIGVPALLILHLPVQCSAGFCHDRRHCNFYHFTLQQDGHERFLGVQGMVLQAHHARHA
jgi:hypothetical protein